MELIRKLKQIDSSIILEEYQRLENDIIWETKDPRTRQSSVQHKEGEDPFLSSCLSLPKGNIEKHYNILNPYFKDSIFEEIINEYNLYRCRLMWVHEKSCYTIHKDSSKRIHLPIITNESCYFLFVEPELSMHHLEVGYVHLVDTTYKHTFCNFSFFNRLHFLGCYDGK